LGFIVKSDDAGKTWQDLTQNIDDPPNTFGDSPAPTVADVTFKRVHGDIHTKNEFFFIAEWATVDDWRGWVLKTTDDGITYSWTSTV
jgi:hypothetical protein